MKQLKIFFRLFLISCLASLGSCAQNPAKELSLQPEIFVGSTPCDSLIRSQLGITANMNCEFIKWQLTMYSPKEGLFELLVTYGQSKPNTNGFINGGLKIETKGKYSITPGFNENPKATFLTLLPDRLNSPLYLIVMDENILHFTDSNHHLLIGNGGWGYVMNRIANTNR
jgi:hypothetical protein